MSSSQKGQVFKLESGLWACRWRDASKRRRQRGGFKLKSEAQTVLDEELRKTTMGSAYRPSSLTLNELVAKFLDQYDAAPATKEWMRYFLRFAQDEFGEAQAAAITPHDIAVWRSRLRTDHEKHGATRALKQVLHAAVRWGWLNSNAAAAARNPQARSVEQNPFKTWLDVEAVAEGMQHPRDVAILILAVGTGLRPEEFFALEWKDINLERGVVSVQRAFAKGRMKGYTKTDRGRRTVPLRDRVIDSLATLDHKHDLVFPSFRGGTHLDLKSWRANIWDPAFDASTVEHRRPYDCRHTYATWSIAAGVDLFTLSRRMGASLTMIDRHYGHLMADADERERDKLNDWDQGRIR